MNRFPACFRAQLSSTKRMLFHIRSAVLTVMILEFACLGGAGAGANWRKLLDQPAGWFTSEEGRQTTDNVLSWQSAHGIWPKNVNTTTSPSNQTGAQIQGTFDNGATVGELRYLARAFQATSSPPSARAFRAGFDAILKSQYATGGWPQSYPSGRGYARHITFNDGAMVGLLQFLREVANSSDFDFVEQKRRKAAREAVARGIDCILKCQVRVDGKLTAWCAQHDEIDLRPRPARSYELVSLSGGESAGIVLFLMSLENPSPAIINSVNAAAAWFDSAKLTGIRVVSTANDRVVVEDSSAPPLWARFYDVDTGRPFFCGRDGVKKSGLADIERERRIGYAWYGDWGARVADRYSTWKSHQTPSDP